MPATPFIIGRHGTQADLLAQAQHGDMLIHTGELRSMGVHFVQALDGAGKPCTKTLVRQDDSGSGYCSVPLSITRHFDDPVAHFLPALVIKSAKITLRDWSVIELDAARHQAFLQTQTAGRAVAPNRRVIFMVGSGEQAKGTYIWSPNTPTDDLNVWKRLNKSIKTEMLGAAIRYQTAADIAKIQQKNRKIHETKFLDWLHKTEVGTLLTVRNIPKDINNRHNEGSSATNMPFVRLYKKDGKTMVVAQDTTYTHVKGKSESIETKTELHFTPELLRRKASGAMSRFGFIAVVEIC